ncbi:hypothetical protein DYY66_2034 [Candidatus Nitrosotalea sp. FS]|uniref:hypothetical protein n=1 Tax=Candidatus Nitrosotalea sp. FS TaxID=2341021 RepID=UPI0014092F8C|nr:hypothetical protein [Candidatus Nitrosotalea sp. FS]NHH96701.1 hypothetical protein [Candidatus Nitrosotalea sp. FS]
MWEPRRKSLKIRVIILIVLSVSFVPISYLWYDALSELDCKKSDQNYVIVNSSDVHNTCISKTSSHWMIFYGVNAMIYGMPLVTLILNSRNQSVKDL